MTARLGLLLGDACGIGPEIVAKLLASDALDPAVATVVIGEPRILARGAGGHRQRGRAAARSSGSSSCDGPARGAAAPGRRSTRRRRRSARSARSPAAPCSIPSAWRSASPQAGELDAICFAPCNKQAMHQGGLELEDELRFFVQVLGFQGLRRRGQCHGRARHHARHLARAAARGGRSDHRGRRAAGDPPRPRHAPGGRPAAPADRRSPGSIRTPATAASSAARRSTSSRPRSSGPGPSRSPRRAPTRPIRCSSGRATARSTRWSRCTTTRARSR